MKAVLAVLTVLVIAHILMLSTMRIYPMNDLPFHLAVSTIHRHMGEPSNRFAEYYHVDLFPNPNCFHPLFCGLRIFPSVDAGNRVYYALYLALLPLSVLLIVRRVGGSTWFALLSLLLLYNMSFRWGFTGYTMAIPFTLLTLYFHLVSLRRGGLLVRILVAVGLCILFFTHAMAGLYCSSLLVLSAVLHGRRSPAGLLREVLPVLPFACLVLWWAFGRATYQTDWPGELLEFYRRDYLGSLGGRWQVLFNDHRHLFAGAAGRTAGALISLCIVGPLVAGLALRSRRFRESLERREVRSVLLFLLVTIACYLLLPVRMRDVYVVYRRTSVFILLWGVTLLGTVYPQRLPRAAVVALCAVCVAYAALWGTYFREFERENSHFVAELLPHDSPGRTLISLVHDRNFRGVPMYTSFGDYHVVWNQGITKGTFAQFKFVGVWPRRPEEWPRPRWAGKPTTEERLRPYETSDFVLLRGVSGPQADIYTRGFERKRSAGKWVLYEKRTASRDSGSNPPESR